MIRAQAMGMIIATFMKKNYVLFAKYRIQLTLRKQSMTPLYAVYPSFDLTCKRVFTTSAGVVREAAGAPKWENIINKAKKMSNFFTYYFILIFNHYINTLFYCGCLSGFKHMIFYTNRRKRIKLRKLPLLHLCREY